MPGKRLNHSPSGTSGFVSHHAPKLAGGGVEGDEGRTVRTGMGVGDRGVEEGLIRKEEGEMGTSTCGREENFRLICGRNAMNALMGVWEHGRPLRWAKLFF